MTREVVSYHPIFTESIRRIRLLLGDTGLGPLQQQVLERLVQKLVAKHQAGDSFAGRAIKDVVTVNGARVILDNGSWGLVRASSNTPNLVVVCESSDSEDEMRAIFADIDAVIRTEPLVGDYDQTI